jgi:hypothetical protein
VVPVRTDEDPSTGMATISTSERHGQFTGTLPTGVSIPGMSTVFSPFRSFVGDIESEYDEFDLDADLEVSVRQSDWLEPSW